MTSEATEQRVFVENVDEKKDEALGVGATIAAGLGDAVDSAMQAGSAVLSHIPGTDEHALAQCRKVIEEKGVDISVVDGSAIPRQQKNIEKTEGTLHTATNPVTGETETHSTEIGAKVDQMWKDAKQNIPGTAEHKATHPTGATTTTVTGGTTATGPGFAEEPLNHDLNEKY
jgi:hypothetical protein